MISDFTFKKDGVIGSWLGSADGTDETVKLQFNSDYSGTLIREWTENDGSIVKQTYFSSSNSIIQSSGLLICDFENEKKVTKIKVSLFPFIFGNRQKGMDGSMYMFQNGIKCFCLRVSFESSEKIGT
ncbi:hypothetical protein [Pseudoalteromonas phenolica]|uniref:Uncharacterized protein n=1 Tax=Pseudoalteromonas phenolica TaxID=161398 RepID=A0A0S2K3F2_9GAMM|nr:hypothetical protein [Pseudoalteromonas phenolica]ALO42765.1 hypothetical protein PP2015_2268 [Pseudoalteromonas phenolica]MBE0356124.1 hypothetical protein [Pseudoalteromonas phenolica O-BC30]RXF00539.1 hypothetical protein D9981_09480 [Pseudoalteromonas phenolica O-BC30]